MYPDQIEKLKHNLFHGSHGAIDDWIAFPWHQGRGQIQTVKPHSSQALAIDFFGTVMCSADRIGLLNAVAVSLGLPESKTWDLALEWQDPANLLKEPRPTQVDAAAIGSDSVILFECKFTETGGACSQLVKRDGVVQCNGNYETQTNPLNAITDRCALTGKKIQYWSWVSQIFSYSANKNYQPCPFAGGTFQWMRNIVLAKAVGESRGIPAAALVVYPDLPHLHIHKEVNGDGWKAFHDQVDQDQVKFESVSYQDLLTLFQGATDDAIWHELEQWMKGKFAVESAQSVNFKRTVI